MTNTDFKEFSDLMDEAGHAFMAKISDGTKKVYWEYLNSYPLETIIDTITALILFGDSFPTIASILKDIQKNIKTA